MNVQKRRKAKRSKAQRTSKKTRKRPKDFSNILKSSATTAFIWGLVIVNLFFIASFISNKLPSSSQNKTTTTQDLTNVEPQTEIPVIDSGSSTKKIEVEVLNGCNVNGLAARVTEYLRIKGFDVVSYGNYYSFDVSETTVIDRRDLGMQNANKVAEALGINHKGAVFAFLNDDKQLDVSVILGSDYKKLQGIPKPEK